MFRLRRSPIGTERQRVVIDTDPGNEIDDQFAIVHALLAADVLDVEALHAAPFTNEPDLSGDRPETLLRDQRQELQRSATRPLHATLPLAHQTCRHVEVAGEHRLARILP